MLYVLLAMVGFLRLLLYNLCSLQCESLHEIVLAATRRRADIAVLGGPYGGCTQFKASEWKAACNSMTSCRSGSLLQDCLRSAGEAAFPPVEVDRIDEACTAGQEPRGRCGGGAAHLYDHVAELAAVLGTAHMDMQAFSSRLAPGGTLLETSTPCDDFLLMDVLVLRAKSFQQHQRGDAATPPSQKKTKAMCSANGSSRRRASIFVSLIPASSRT